MAHDGSNPHGGATPPTVILPPHGAGVHGPGSPPPDHAGWWDVVTGLWGYLNPTPGNERPD
ncbi:MAG TPA: hypothetical protein VFR81_21340 [Longimicrobium sp.]|nr:hypothetical protein [Longimicrobium sp.]